MKKRWFISLMEGARISWDELNCVGYPVTEEVTERLCHDIEEFRKKAGLAEHTVKKEQLINWKILKQSEGRLLATNAYALLTSDYFPFSKTQCAVFKGTYNGLTYEEIMNGHSKIRNKGIANIFAQMGLVEAWGSGIKRIFNAANEYGLEEPRIQEFDNMFRVELFRNNFAIIKDAQNIGEASEKYRRSIEEASEKHRRNIGEKN